MADENTPANGLVTRVKSWAARPFTEEMDLIHWGLMALFLTTIVVLWMMVLNNLKNALE